MIDPKASPGRGQAVSFRDAARPGAFRNEFSWSLSRERVLRECARKYYYTHYGMWEGWSPASSPRTREIYILKNLKSRQMWAGTVVHDALRRSIRMLQNGQPVLATDEIVRITLARMRADWISSKRRQNRIDPKRRLGLLEHEYAIPVETSVWRALAAQVETSLRNFYASPLFEELQATPTNNYLAAHEARDFMLDAGSETIRLWLQIDCAFRREDGSVVIANWRTGRASAETDDQRVQLASQSLYAMQTWKVPLDRIRLIELSLRDGRMICLTASRADIEAARAFIAGSVRDMRALLTDPERNAGREDDFQRTSDLRRCLSCSYRRLCRKPAMALPAPAASATLAPARLHVR